MKRIVVLLCIVHYALCVASAQDSLTIAMTGDIMMGTTWPTKMLPSDNGAKLFDDAKPILRRANLAIGNLEGTLLDGGKTWKSGGPNSYAFRTPTSYAPLLKEAGFDFLSMANNHANDFGQEGILSTEKCLKQQGIKFAGVEGRTETAIIESNGLKIGLCAFGHNSYTLKHTDLETVGRIVDKLVKETDIVIVSFHGGAEGRTKNHLPQGAESFLGENRGSLRQFAHFCIDHGADIVYGHGPHVTRAMELYKGRFIAYSLGNFCTPYNVSLIGISGYAPLVEVMIDREGSFIGGQIHSMHQLRGVGPRLDKEHRAAREIKSLSEADIKDNKLRIDNNGRITAK